MIAFVGAIVVLGLLYLFLHRTYLGLAIRATAQDLEMAEEMGINPRIVYYLTLAAGGVLTGVVATAFLVPLSTPCIPILGPVSRSWLL